MSDSDALCNPPPDPDVGFLPFENRCGRPGCTHIFKCSGLNPLGALAALVKAHKPHCPGRNFGATHRCHTDWEPSEALIESFQQPHGRPAINSGDQNAGATDAADKERETSETSQQSHKAGHSSEKAMDDGGDSDQIHRHSRSRSDATEAQCPKPKPMKKRKRAPVPQPVTPPDTELDAAAPPPFRVKKSANSESVRRAALEADPWTDVVEPKHVVCRGCKNRITLDQRSLYYPGLWHKHRKRCPAVRIGQEKEEKEKERMESTNSKSVNELKTSVGGRCPLEDADEAPSAKRARQKYYDESSNPSE